MSSLVLGLQAIATRLHNLVFLAESAGRPRDGIADWLAKHFGGTGW